MTRRIDGARHGPPHLWSRLAFAAALTTFLLGGFVSAGGLGYAASGAADAAEAVKQVFAQEPLVRGATAAADQYREEVLPEEAAEAAPAEVLFEVEEQEALPFTGLTLAPAVVLGLLLLALGVFLRRRETGSG